MPTPTNDEQMSFIRQHAEELSDYVVELAYVCGWRDKSDKALFYRRDFSHLRIGWWMSHGITRLHVLNKDGVEQCKEWRIFSRYHDGFGPYASEYGREGLRNEFRAKVAEYTDGMLMYFFPNIKVVASLRQCHSPFHLNRWHTDNQISFTPVITICTPRYDRWYCDECHECYSLPPIIDRAGQPIVFAKGERAKMNDSLRWKVMERDEFMCQICGRSRMKGDDIKLHVDHKMPIAKGGKTELDNLWTLCASCNLGKRDRVVTQITMGI